MTNPIQESEDCWEYDTCPGSKPFFVGHNNPRFPTSRGGYLPSDCPCFYYKPQSDIIERQTIYVENLTDGKFLQLQALVHNLRDRLDKITVKKQRKYA